MYSSFSVLSPDAVSNAVLIFIQSLPFLNLQHQIKEVVNLNALSLRYPLKEPPVIFKNSLDGPQMGPRDDADILPKRKISVLSRNPVFRMHC